MLGPTSRIPGSSPLKEIKVGPPKAGTLEDLAGMERRGADLFELKLDSAYLKGVLATECVGVPDHMFRGPPKDPAVLAIEEMTLRAAQSTVRLQGDSVSSLLQRAVFSNPAITNEQIIEMSKVPLSAMATSPELRSIVEGQFPRSRELPSHRFVVGLLAAVTGVDPEELSKAAPDLGLMGSAGMHLTMEPWGGIAATTAFHDFTDTLRDAGVNGINDAVWGNEGPFASAIRAMIHGTENEGSLLGEWK